MQFSIQNLPANRLGGLAGSREPLLIDGVRGR